MSRETMEANIVNLKALRLIVGTSLLIEMNSDQKSGLSIFTFE